MQEPDVKQVEALLIGMAIPPQQKIVLDLTDILKRPDLEFGETIKLVSSEVALSAKMIKWVNPPLFITNSKVDFMNQPLMKLGFKNFYNLVLVSFMQ